MLATKSSTPARKAWKLRERLATTQPSRAAAIAISDDIVISTLAANAQDQPTAVLEVFIADDDDANLNNGTPHFTELVYACNQHALPYPGSGTTVTTNDTCASALLVVAVRRLRAAYLASPLYRG